MDGHGIPKAGLGFAASELKASLVRMFGSHSPYDR